MESSGHETYAVISIGFNRTPILSDFPGNASSAWHWDRWTNVSQVQAGIVTVNGTLHFVLNVTAVYLAPAPSNAPAGSVEATVSRGVFSFALAPPGSPWGLTVFPLFPLVGAVTIPGGASKDLWGASDLPQTLPLAEYPATIVPASTYASLDGGDR